MKHFETLCINGRVLSFCSRGKILLHKYCQLLNYAERKFDNHKKYWKQIWQIKKSWKPSKDCQLINISSVLVLVEIAFCWLNFCQLKKQCWALSAKGCPGLFRQNFGQYLPSCIQMLLRIAECWGISPFDRGSNVCGTAFNLNTWPFLR